MTRVGDDGQKPSEEDLDWTGLDWTGKQRVPADVDRRDLTVTKVGSPQLSTHKVIIVREALTLFL